jgi:hypothetical protein
MQKILPVILLEPLAPPYSKMDVITMVHHTISYEAAEKDKQVFEIVPNLFLNIVPYEILKEMKFRSARDKDLFDIARLEELRKKSPSLSKPAFL